MRSAGNFHPEWGYLAPVPSFMRNLRIALVATAVGATAGAAVVVSLVARPASGTADSSIATHAVVAGPLVNSASAAVAPAPVQSNAPPAEAAASPVAGAPQQAGVSGEIAGASQNPADSAPAQVAHVEEPAAAPVHEEPALAPDAASGKKAATKKHRVAGYETMRRWQGKKSRHSRGFAPLFRLFSSRGGSPFSAN